MEFLIKEHGPKRFSILSMLSLSPQAELLVEEIKAFKNLSIIFEGS